MSAPLVSVCVPSLGREEKLARLLDLIPKTAEWPHEVIVEHDSFEDRQGCPKTMARAVDRAAGEYVAFVGNDCLPQQGWLRIAMETLLGNWSDGMGVCGFNDLYWSDGRCLHFVASKSMLPLLGGHFLNPCYAHAGCDDELVARSKQAGRYLWCPEAVVAHDHFLTGAQFDTVYQVAWAHEAIERDRKLLRERAEQMGFKPWLPE